ncbi:MAG: sulfotransferase [Gammaproteobacteria bacterium]|nr:sulfotransferase [Gammaproteobacteria bacterium]
MNTHDLKTAIRLHRNGRLQAAHDIYTNLVEARPADAKLRSLYGQLELQMGIKDSAIDHLRDAARLAPEDDRIALTLARGLATVQQHDEALNITHKLLAKDDQRADAWSTLAAVHRHRNDHVNELLALERASELWPDDVPTLIARANAEAANSFLDRAIETLRGAATKAPRNARVVNNLGTLLLRRNNLDGAAAALRQALKISPDYAMAASNLSMVLHRMGELDAAREMAERALKLAPNNIDARSELAAVLMANGDLAGAEAGFKAALELAPTHQRALAGLAELRERQGRATEGLSLITKIIESNQASPDVRLVGASLARRVGRREIALEMLTPLLDGNGRPLETLDRATRRRLGFLLGDIYDASADYGAALGHYDVANAVLRPDFDTTVHSAYIDTIITAFDKNTVRRATVVERTPKRLFLIGMPRSGTSLLETMLSGHPEIHACGELALIGRLVNESGDYPTGISTLDDVGLDRMGDHYCASTAAPTGIRWMTDRMALNYFYLGAISKILPDALIIHCNRFPADCLLSCYFQNFLDPSLGFSFSLDSLHHYWLSYSRLMHHWQEILGDQILDIQYEELVASPESVLRPLLERLDVEWNDAVLNPEEAGRHASSPSHTQAWQPIHSRSVGRFARYRPFLAERAEAIGHLA